MQISEVKEINNKFQEYFDILDSVPDDKLESYNIYDNWQVRMVCSREELENFFNNNSLFERDPRFDFQDEKLPNFIHRVYNYIRGTFYVQIKPGDYKRPEIVKIVVNPYQRKQMDMDLGVNKYRYMIPIVKEIGNWIIENNKSAHIYLQVHRIGEEFEKISFLVD